MVRWHSLNVYQVKDSLWTLPGQEVVIRKNFDDYPRLALVKWQQKQIRGGEGAIFCLVPTQFVCKRRLYLMLVFKIIPGPVTANNIRHSGQHHLVG